MPIEKRARRSGFPVGLILLVGVGAGPGCGSGSSDDDETGGGPGAGGGPAQGGGGGSPVSGAAPGSGGSTAGAAGGLTRDRCEGTPAIAACSECSGVNPPCDCLIFPGCQANNTANCTGTSLVECATFGTDSSACRDNGCTMGTESGVCEGGDCAEIRSLTACTNRPGCTLEGTRVECTGSPRRCAVFAPDACEAVPGCQRVPG